MNINIKKNNEVVYLLNVNSVKIVTNKELPKDKKDEHRMTGNTPNRDEFVDCHCVTVSNSTTSVTVTLYDIIPLLSAIESESYVELVE